MVSGVGAPRAHSCPVPAGTDGCQSGGIDGQVVEPGRDDRIELHLPDRLRPRGGVRAAEGDLAQLRPLERGQVARPDVEVGEVERRGNGRAGKSGCAR